jgi:hypothetical protein
VGEVIEWFGYAIMVNTVVAYGFAISTAFIVGNRAIGHHECTFLKKKKPIFF